MIQVSKASTISKHGRAGPGTGSMGGRCSVCGDRATKVTSSPCLVSVKAIELNILVPIQSVLDHILLFLSRILPKISGWQ